MSVQIKLRRDTAANWVIVNPILGQGEPGLETDTLKLKYGDGVTRWNQLTYPTVYATPTPAAALTGNALPANIQNAPGLTSIGTLTDLTVTNAIEADITGNAATATQADLATAAVNATNAVFANIASGLSGGAANQLVYQTSIGNIGYVVIPALAGTFLTWNGTTFSWSDIPPPDAADLTGTTLASTITASSLTSVGTLTGLTVSTQINGSITGSAGEVAALNITGTTLPNGITTANGLTSIGTLTNLAVTNPITGSVSGSAGSVAAANITGSTLASNVTGSSLTSVGTLASLTTSGNVIVGGDLTVNGTTTTVNSTTLAVDDKNIILGDVSTPSDITADGGGFTLKGATDKTFNWVNASDAWTSSEHLALASGKTVIFGDATAQSTAFQDVAAHLYFVHPSPGNTYTATGTVNSPFNTITAAVNAAVAAGYSDSNPASIVLLASITENVTLKPGIYLTSLGTGTHGSPNITGTVTVTSSTGTTSSNHYSISNLRIIAPTNGHCINFTGTAPQKLFVRDMWLDANGTGDGIYMDNSGSGSTVQFDVGHLAHSGSGDIYCINVTAGSCYVTDIETTGATQVAAVQDGATLTIDGSELDASGDVVCETYGSGILYITNSSVTNAQANSNGIKINGTGSTVVIGNTLFTIPSGSGKAIAYPGATLYASTVAYANVVFAIGSNTSIDANLLLVPQTVVPGLLAAPVVTSPMTTTDTTFNLLNTTATTISFGGAASTLNIGATSGTTTIKNPTVTIGSAATGNILKLASTASGTASLTTDITNGTLSVFTSVTGTITLGAAAGTLTTPSTVNTGGTTATLYNTTSTTINFGGAATTVAEFGPATSLSVADTATTTGTYNFVTGATLTGNTKTVNIGTNGASGSTTAINLGSANGTTTTINGTVSVANGTLTKTTTSSTSDADATVDASLYEYYAYVQSASATTRSINVSNLTAGKKITLYLRNTNAGTKTINILASTTTSSFAAVNMSKGDAGGASATAVTLAVTTGTAVVTVFNINGVIGGSIS